MTDLLQDTKVVNVIPNSKFNKKLDHNTIFLPGNSIIDEINTHGSINPFLVNPPKTKNGRKIRYNSARREYDRKYVRNSSNNTLQILLDGRFSKVDHVPGLKTSLYPHQQTAVKAMLDMEYYRTITPVCYQDPANQSGTGQKRLKISYNAAVLSEPVGSGKTFDALALILLSKVPRAVPDITVLPYGYDRGSTMGYIQRKFKKFLTPTIIFVGISVLRQWEKAILTYTNLKLYKVNTINDLRPLLTMIVNGTVNKYDIILIKNGKFTVKIQLPAGIELEDKNKTAQPYFYNIIANFRQYCWARVIVDDFDTIKLPRNAGIVNGLFTWYISSTRTPIEVRSSSTQLVTKASEILKYFDYGCASITYNHLLFENLNVRNSITYVKETTSIPNPKYWVAVFTNPNNKYISLLVGLDDTKVNQITEMLNGDAIGEAAEAAGIKTDSVANIFEKILGGKFQQYRYATDLLSFIDHCYNEEPNWLAMNRNPDENDTYGKRDLLAFREIEYKYPGINSLLKNTNEEYTEIKKTSGVAIDRVKENIKAGQCPICRDDLTQSDDTAIAKCCGTVFCGLCAIEGQNLKDRYRKLSGRCSKCRAEITIKDLIYMENFDLSKIEEDEFEEDDEDVVKAKMAKETQIAAQSGPINKYTAIINIIRGLPVPNSTRVDMHIPNMMKGGAYLPEATVRKVLIFANYNETLQHVIKKLDEEKIKYWRLMGSSANIDNISTEFTNCTTTCALVINSSEHCSGLNLQTATDLVFAHLINSPAIESQVAGRGHRLGRKSPLNIWYLQYENEVDTLRSTHSVRNLSAEELAEETKFTEGKLSTSISGVVDNCDSSGDLKTKCPRKKPKDDDSDDIDDNDSDGNDDSDDNVVENVTRKAVDSDNDNDNVSNSDDDNSTENAV